MSHFVRSSSCFNFEGEIAIAVEVEVENEVALEVEVEDEVDVAIEVEVEVAVEVVVEVASCNAFYTLCCRNWWRIL